MKFKKRIFLPLTICFFILLSIQNVILANTEGDALKETKIAYDICKEAKIESFGFSIQEDDVYGVYLSVKFKNISNQPERFKITLETSDGIVVGSYVPRSGKPPVKLEVGNNWEGNFPLPMKVVPEEIVIYIEIVDFYD